MHHCKTKPHKSKVYVLLYKQTGSSGISQLDFVDRKLISGILSYSTYEINYGQPWFISNVPYVGKNATNKLRMCHGISI